MTPTVAEQVPALVAIAVAELQKRGYAEAFEHPARVLAAAA